MYFCFLYLKQDHWIPYRPEALLDSTFRSEPEGPVIRAEVWAQATGVNDIRIQNAKFTKLDVMPDGSVEDIDLNRMADGLGLDQRPLAERKIDKVVSIEPELLKKRPVKQSWEPTAALSEAVRIRSLIMIKDKMITGKATGVRSN